MNRREQVSTVLSQIENLGESTPELSTLVYSQLREMAVRYFQQERAGHTLQPTAVVHEAYMKLVDQQRVGEMGRTHFFAVAARAMRQVLINHAVARDRQKRGGEWQRVPMNGAVFSDPSREFCGEQALALESALKKLANLHERQARLVELLYFGGMTQDEAARALEVSTRTVERDWNFTRAWLRRELSSGARP